jgi:hypothetical protein
MKLLIKDNPRIIEEIQNFEDVYVKSDGVSYKIGNLICRGGQYLLDVIGFEKPDYYVYSNGYNLRLGRIKK